MAAAYDNFDYPSYWINRQYEHLSEMVALNALLGKIPKINRLIEIGGGYGRILPTYLFRARSVVFTDPSARLMAIAKKNFKSNKIKFIHSKVENLKTKTRSGSYDTVICVRVLHHIKCIDEVFGISSRLLKKGGFFILEFPNKRHFKAVFNEFVRGNFTFYSDIFPKDLSPKDDDVLPFVNYHPDEIKMKLRTHGFEILDERSVSNIRSTFVKKHVPLDALLWLEKLIQVPLSKMYFGPSIFILSKKK